MAAKLFGDNSDALLSSVRLLTPANNGATVEVISEALPAPDGIDVVDADVDPDDESAGQSAQSGGDGDTEAEASDGGVLHSGSP